MMHVTVGESDRKTTSTHKNNTIVRWFWQKHRLVQSHNVIEITFVFLEVGENSHLSYIPPLPRFAKCSQPGWPVLANIIPDLTLSASTVRLTKVSEMVLDPSEKPDNDLQMAGYNLSRWLGLSFLSVRARDNRWKIIGNVNRRVNSTYLSLVTQRAGGCLLESALKLQQWNYQQFFSILHTLKILNPSCNAVCEWTPDMMDRSIPPMRNDVIFDCVEIPVMSSNLIVGRV